MSGSLRIDVRGLPRPQGSMQLFRNGGSKYPKGVYIWRGQVQAAVATAIEGQPCLDGAVELGLGFDLPRPLGHYGTGRNSHTVKPSSPAWPHVMPDLDKLVRAVADACTDAGVWHDDAQVVSLRAAKRYTLGPPGVLITITPLEAPHDQPAEPAPELHEVRAPR